MTTVRLPWPPAATSPNASRQGDWRGRSSAARKYKTACAWECTAAAVASLDADAVEVTVTFCPPRAGRYDLDNAQSRIKQGLDAFATAIGVDDARWSSMTLERGLPMRGGAVFVTATPCGVDGFSGESPARPLKGHARDGSKRSGAGGATNAIRPLTIDTISGGSRDG